MNYHIFSFLHSVQFHEIPETADKYYEMLGNTRWDTRNPLPEVIQ